MSKIIINVTQQSIVQELERILERYADYPYQQTFAHPDHRQDLLVWVLNRVPNIFQTLNDSEVASLDHISARYSPDQRACIEAVIRQGIEEVLNRHQSELAQDIPAQSENGQAASHWFG